MWGYEVAKRYLYRTWDWTLYVYRTFLTHIVMATKLGHTDHITGAERTQETPETPNRVQLTYGTMQENEDTVDFPPSGAVTQALAKLSGAIYTVCFSNWHCPPEKMEEQPLYKEIHTAIDGIYANIRAHARPLEVYEILIAVTNALIIHLKNFRKNRVSYKYNSQQEEIDFLRQQTRCLLLYWLPDSLRTSNHILVFLIEILSINVLWPAINNLSDFNIINETIVRKLENEDIVEPLNCPLPKASYGFFESDSIAHSQKQGMKTFKKRQWWPLRKRGTKKNPKALESDSGFRSFIEDQEEDTVDSASEDQLGWNRDGSDDNDFVTSICDTVLEKWRQENWTAIVEKTTDKRMFKICVCDMNSSNTKLWITDRDAHDFREIYDLLGKKYQMFNKLEEEDEEKKFFQAIDTTPDEFLDLLVGLIKDHQEPEAVFFLSPFKYDKETRERFNTPFSDSEDLLPDDSNTESNQSDQESDEDAGDSNGCYESDGFKALKFLKKKKQTNNSNKKSSKEPEVSPCEPGLQHTVPLSDNLISSIESAGVFSDEPQVRRKRDYKLEQSLFKKKNEDEMTKQRKKLEQTLLNSLYQLCDELLAGGRSVLRFMDKIGLLKGISKEIQEKIPKLFEEDQIEWYFDQISELLLSKVDPLPYTPQELKSKAQELLRKNLQNLMNTVVKFFFEHEVLRSITASHEAFQNQKANKETLFKLLEDLTRIIINGSQECKSD